jgi:hypothetical protein
MSEHTHYTHEHDQHADHFYDETPPIDPRSPEEPTIGGVILPDGIEPPKPIGKLKKPERYDA